MAHLMSPENCRDKVTFSYSKYPRSTLESFKIISADLRLLYEDLSIFKYHFTYMFSLVGISIT